MGKQRITILGATGSVGVSTLDVVGRHPDLYEVYALTAFKNRERLLEQCIRFSPLVAVIGSSDDALWLESELKTAGFNIAVAHGPEALIAVASEPEVDTVMAAIVGGAGLLPSLAAANSGKKVLLANKEALVMAGELFMQAARNSGARILPIDSEHNAIFQCLPVNQQARFEQRAHAGFTKIILTASGGPFLQTPLADLHAVTPDQACAHPNWKMGRKISVDSATMINKALELIEACYLFEVPANLVEILIHPQSIVHSMVCYCDGSVLAQLGNPDMRTPIAYGLAWPNRLDSGVSPLDLASAGALSFCAADEQRFPGLQLGREVALNKGAGPIIFNAANEIAVAAFLDSRLGFTEIPVIIDRVLQVLNIAVPESVDAVLEIDALSRKQALIELSAANSKRVIG